MEDTFAVVIKANEPSVCGQGAAEVQLVAFCCPPVACLACESGRHELVHMPRAVPEGAAEMCSCHVRRM